MYPILPHTVSECLENLGEDKNIPYWPSFDKKYLVNNESIIVIQINGKKRGIIKCNLDIEENKLVEDIKNNSQYDKYLKNKNIFRVIYIKNKIINLIIK